MFHQFYVTFSFVIVGYIIQILQHFIHRVSKLNFVLRLVTLAIIFFFSLVFPLLVHLMLIIYFPFFPFSILLWSVFFSLFISTSLATCFNRRVRCTCSIMSLYTAFKKKSHLSSVSNLIKFTPKLNQFANKTLSVIFAMNESVLWSNTFSHSLFLCFA